MHAIAWAVLAFVTASAWSITSASDSARQQATGAPFAGVLDEHPVIQYALREPRDRVWALKRSLADGRRTLAYEPATGYLKSVLDALDIPIESQLLLFSKTGVQRALTGPQNPRALYFNDSVTVGYIQGASLIEIASHDPELGVVFYTVDQNASSPALTRRLECLTCHVSASTLEVPGVITRSNVMGLGGAAIPQLGSIAVTHRTPLRERWGGWFVTGDYASPPYAGTAHQGNTTVTEHSASGPVTTSNEEFIAWTNSAPERRGYLSRESDIAPLMLFDHQSHAINLLTRLGWESRVAAASGTANFDVGPLRDLVDEVADYLLFVDEAPQPGRVIPRRGFAERFVAAGAKDRQGRSLRELDFERRLLRYPCSYMIHTDAFDHLPTAARQVVYQRMWTILSGKDPAAKYSHLSTADRRAIIEILRDTKKDLPSVFQNRS